MPPSKPVSHPARSPSLRYADLGIPGPAGLGDRMTSAHPPKSRPEARPSQHGTHRRNAHRQRVQVGFCLQLHLAPESLTLLCPVTDKRPGHSPPGPYHKPPARESCMLPSTSAAPALLQLTGRGASSHCLARSCHQSRQYWCRRNTMSMSTSPRCSRRGNASTLSQSLWQMRRV